MPKLKFAIVGFGKMGQIRYKTLSAMEGCEVVCICEPDDRILIPEGLENTKNVDDVFKRDDVDAVIVATPNNYIKDYVVKGLNSGKHVFSEKPPGRNILEINEMIKAEESNPKCKLMFGFNHRHHESMLHAKKLIDSKKYGRILWMRGRYGKSVDEAFFNNWRSKKELAGGGIFLDQGIHMLDLFLMFCGDFQEVKSFVSNCYWNLNIEDNVFAMFRNDQGQVASLHSTMTQWRHIFSLEIFLEQGYITINGLKTSTNSYGDEAMTIAHNRTKPPEASWTEEENINFHTDYSWEKELTVFLESIRGNKPVPLGNSQDALKLMKLVEKVYQQY